LVLIHYNRFSLFSTSDALESRFSIIYSTIIETIYSNNTVSSHYQPI